MLQTQKVTICNLEEVVTFFALIAWSSSCPSALCRCMLAEFIYLGEKMSSPKHTNVQVWNEKTFVF